MGQLKIKILGCGASGGVPAIGNNWGMCDPQEPKNNRTRASVAVQSDTTNMIIDTGPDFRLQLNREDISTVDAIIYTHAHGDHVAGIDELRSFQRRSKKSVPIYGNEATLNELEHRFEYMFYDTANGLYPRVLSPSIFTEEDFGHVKRIGDISFIPFEQDHTTCKTLGFRFGDVAYCTDMVQLGEKEINIIKGVKTWIVDGSGHYQVDNIVHASIPQIIEMNKTIQAENVYFTHLTLMMDYKKMTDELPEGFYPCYDGLEFITNQET